MKKIVFIYLIVMSFCTNAQNVTNIEKSRYIYLWDVTLSMKGYQDRTPDIYDDVVKYLQESIDGLPNGKNKEIIVCPFQEEILAIWKDICTIDGKNNIKKRISEFNNNNITRTNLVDPLNYVEDNFVDAANYETTIHLLTDGNHNADKKSFKDYLDNHWKTENRFLHLKIIKLNKDILEDIIPGGSVEVLEGHEKLLTITPSSYINYNIIEANRVGIQEIKVEFKPNPTNATIPEGIKVRVHSAKNSIIDIDEILTIEDGNLVIPLDYDYQKLKVKYEGKKTMILYYDIQEDCQRIKKGKDIYVISVESPITEVNVANEPQKTLKITLK